jgi:hypothetical protein
MFDSWEDAGFAPEEHAAWRNAARYCLASAEFEPDHQALLRTASRWRIAGFTPAEVRQWQNALPNFEDRERLAPEARKWRDYGYSPDEAFRWASDIRGPCEELEYEKLFSDAGWHPYGVGDLYLLAPNSRGPGWEATRRAWASLPELHALNCSRAGLAPEEARECLPLDPAELDILLHERYETRQPIDPYTAMRFNHYMFMTCGETPDHELPFCARHVWDMHDDDDQRAIEQGASPPYGGPCVPRPGWVSQTSNRG